MCFSEKKKKKKENIWFLYGAHHIISGAHQLLSIQIVTREKKKNLFLETTKILITWKK